MVRGDMPENRCWGFMEKQMLLSFGNGEVGEDHSWHEYIFVSTQLNTNLYHRNYDSGNHLIFYSRN